MHTLGRSSLSSATYELEFPCTPKGCMEYRVLQEFVFGPESAMYGVGRTEPKMRRNTNLAQFNYHCRIHDRIHDKINY